MGWEMGGDQGWHRMMERGTEGESAVRTCVRACVKVREGE